MKAYFLNQFSRLRILRPWINQFTFALLLALPENSCLLVNRGVCEAYVQS